MRIPFLPRLQNNIGIDLGTANTLVYVEGKGIIINEPSVVAVNQKTERVVAIGVEAKKMLGRTPAHIEAIRPLVDGVVSHFETTEEMIRYFLQKAEKISGTFTLFRPRVIVGVPYGITNVERRAVIDATKNAGAKEVFIVEEPMSAAIGANLPVHEPIGNMIIDVGGGTTEIAVISLSGIVCAKSIKLAGETLNSDIISYVKEEFKVLLGEKTAEDLKILIGSVYPASETLEARVRGRDLVTGLPREIAITDNDIREAIANSIRTFLESVTEVIEATPPELIADIMHRGILLVGGGSLIHGMSRLLEEELKIPVHTEDEALTVVVRGMGIILEDIEHFKDILIGHEDELLPRAR